jgi:hypothetical protein
LRLLHAVHHGFRNGELAPVRFIVDLFVIFLGDLGDNLSTILQVDNIRKQKGGEKE